MPAVYIELKKDPNHPSPEVPRPRFVKDLDATPWAGAVEAVVLLEEHTWELLGYPQLLKATLEAG